MLHIEFYEWVKHLSKAANLFLNMQKRKFTNESHGPPILMSLSSSCFPHSPILVLSHVPS